MTDQEFDQFVARELMKQPVNAKRKRIESRPPRCGTCKSCIRPDCGLCINCLDKPRFGGQGKRKKACVKKVCDEAVHTLENSAQWQTTSQESTQDTHLPLAESEVARIDLPLAESKGARID